jgi:ABC-2 type transport system permease protein
MAALIIFFLSIYPSFSRDAAEFDKLIQGYPEAVRKAVGLGSDIFSFLGFYSYVFLYIMLCGAIQGMNLGTSILSKEIRQKTADFLLTKPVARKEIMTAKLLAALVILVITNVIYVIAAGAMAFIVNTRTFNIKIFIMISVTLFFIQLIFLSLGVVISVIVPKIRSVIAVSLGTVFGFFIINMFGSVIGDEALKYITPFKYFDTAYIIKNSAYEMPYMIIGAVFVAAAIGASYLIYSRRDIHAV